MMFNPVRGNEGTQVSVPLELIGQGLLEGTLQVIVEHSVTKPGPSSPWAAAKYGVLTFYDENIDDFGQYGSIELQRSSDERTIGYVVHSNSLLLGAGNDDTGDMATVDRRESFLRIYRQLAAEVLIRDWLQEDSNRRFWHNRQDVHQLSADFCRLSLSDLLGDRMYMVAVFDKSLLTASGFPPEMMQHYVEVACVRVGLTPIYGHTSPVDSAESSHSLGTQRRIWVEDTVPIGCDLTVDRRTHNTYTLARHLTRIAMDVQSEAHAFLAAFQILEMLCELLLESLSADWIGKLPTGVTIVRGHKLRKKLSNLGEFPTKLRLLAAASDSSAIPKWMLERALESIPELTKDEDQNEDSNPGEVGNRESAEDRRAGGELTLLLLRIYRARNGFVHNSWRPTYWTSEHGIDMHLLVSVLLLLTASLTADRIEQRHKEYLCVPH